MSNGSAEKKKFEDTLNRLHESRRRALQQKAERAGLLPRSAEEALRHIREGLTRVIDACSVLRENHSEHAFSPDRWHLLRMLSESLLVATKSGQGEALEVLKGPTRQLQKQLGGIAHGASRVQEKAAEFANVLRQAKTIGLPNALLRKNRPSQEWAWLPTRRHAAAYLAIALSAVDRELPAPVLNTRVPAAERERVILERMPLGHGHQRDRLCQHSNELFDEDPEKTVIAAFKALGMSRQRADQLFKAKLVRENRKRARRRSAKR